MNSFAGTGTKFPETPRNAWGSFYLFEECILVEAEVRLNRARLVPVTPGLVPGVTLVTVAFQWICILGLTLCLHLWEHDSGHVPGASHSPGSAYLTSGTAAVTLWPVRWEPLRQDIENLSANEITDSGSRGVCSLKQSWGEFSPSCGNTLLLLLKTLKWFPEVANQFLRQLVSFSSMASLHPIMSPISCSPGQGRGCPSYRQTGGLFLLLDLGLCSISSKCLLYPFSNLKPTIFQGLQHPLLHILSVNLVLEWLSFL